MTREEKQKAIDVLKISAPVITVTQEEFYDYIQTLNKITDWLEQEPCEMTVEEYRQRMIDAFHNADCGELIAICVLPTEKEFEHLKWLLKNHYKKEPCGDAISRQYLIDKAVSWDKHFADGIRYVALTDILNAPSVTPQPREDAESAQVELEGDGYADGQIVYDWGKCPNCGWEFEEGDKDWEEPYCCHCGQKLHWFEDEGGDAE